MNPQEPVLHKCRDVLASLYGDRFKGAILYGSSARGTDSEHSDIDLLVLLDGPVNVAREIYRIWDVLYAVQLESERVISVMPADVGSYRKGQYALYRNAQQYGVSL